MCFGPGCVCVSTVMQCQFNFEISVEEKVDSHQSQLLSFSGLEAAICKLSGPIKANGWSCFSPSWREHSSSRARRKYHRDHEQLSCGM